MNRENLLKILILIQNSTDNENRDIVSFAGMCDLNELTEHVFTQWKNMTDFDRKIKIMEIAKII